MVASVDQIRAWLDAGNAPERAVRMPVAEWLDMTAAAWVRSEAGKGSEAYDPHPRAIEAYRTYSWPLGEHDPGPSNAFLANALRPYYGQAGVVDPRAELAALQSRYGQAGFYVPDSAGFMYVPEVQGSWLEDLAPLALVLAPIGGMVLMQAGFIGAAASATGAASTAGAAVGEATISAELAAELAAGWEASAAAVATQNAALAEVAGLLAPGTVAATIGQEAASVALADAAAISATPNPVLTQARQTLPQNAIERSLTQAGSQLVTTGVSAGLRSLLGDTAAPRAQAPAAAPYQPNWLLLAVLGAGALLVLKG